MSLFAWLSRGASEDDIAEIRNKHNQLKDVLNKHDKPITSDLEFHLTVAKSCQGSALIRFLLELQQPIWHWIKQKVKYDWGDVHVFDQRKAILQAIKSHLQSAVDRITTSIQDENN